MVGRHAMACIIIIKLCSTISTQVVGLEGDTCCIDGGIVHRMQYKSTKGNGGAFHLEIFEYALTVNVNELSISV